MIITPGIHEFIKVFCFFPFHGACAFNEALDKKTL